MDIARYAAFAHEFNVPGAADGETYCCAFNVALAGGCSRPRVCPCKHEMPPSFDAQRWWAAFSETYSYRQWNRVQADFWDGQIQCVRNRWPSHAERPEGATDGVVECTYKGCRFYWTYARWPSMQVYALRGACPCENDPRCVTCLMGSR